MKAFVVALALGLAWGAAPRHFDVAATFEPARKAGALPSVAVSFSPLDPDVHINEEPAPRLKLDVEQTVLVDKQAPPSDKTADWDPDRAKYLDLAKPVRFPVALAKGAPKGSQSVKATVIFFYCSSREGWCRRGTSELEVPVTVP
jgi:hypothetical protein